MNAAPERTQRAITKTLVDLAWPIVGLNVLQVLALAVDTAMVGRTPHAETALTGLGYATQIVFLLMVAMIGLTVGTVALVARAHGARQDARVDHIFHQSTQFTVALGVAVAILGNVVAVPLLRLLGADEPGTAAGAAYLRPLLFGAAFNYLNILFAAVLRGVGNTRVALLVALVMNALNVVFNYGLILGNYGLPALGVQGAAIGTVCAQGFAVVLMWWLLGNGAVKGLRARLGVRRPDGVLARDLLRIGWPASMDMLILNASFLSIVSMLGRIDQVAVAAHGIGLRVQALAFVPGMSISQATGAMVGMALGRGAVEEARRVLRSSIVLSCVVMTTLAALILSAATPIVELFDVEEGSALFDHTVDWLTLLGLGIPLAGVYISFVGLFQGSGATRLSLRINLISTLLVQIPLSYALAFPLGYGAWGAWAGFPLAFLVKIAMAVVAYRRGTWARIGARV